MTQDFAKPTTTRKQAPKKGSKPRGGKQSGSQHNKQPPAPKGRGKLVALLVCLVLGFGYALYLLQSVPPTPTNETPSKAERPAPKTNKSSPSETNATPDTPEQRFKFYDLLPESIVETPKVDAYQYKERGADDSVTYMIQTGSFRNLADAERQKAMIAFQGLKASITTVQNAQGTTWHRVSTGPFQSRSDMNSALDKLVAINIEPLVKKVKP
ncbi:MAG: SPOR domain-containing protein [Oleiphilaceae bacterium]|nr:SPOR domain-containing protein [Oleiphilaceae bacterium]